MTAPPAGARSVTVSTVSQLGAKVVHLALNAVSTLVVLHYLAPDAYGTYVLVLTVTTLAGVVADFGLPKLAIREMLRPGEDAGAVVGTVVLLRLALALVAVALVQVVLLPFHAPPAAHLAGLLASLGIVVEAVLGVVVTVFHVHVAQQYEAFVRVVAEAVETGLVVVLVVAHAPLPWLFAPAVVGLLVGLVLARRLASRRFAVRARVDARRLRPLLVEALPLGPALMIGVLYLRLDSFVVAAQRPSRDLGIYGAAYQPIEYLFLGSAVVVNVLYPLTASAWAGQDRARFLALYRRGTELLLVVMLLVPVVTLVLAPELVALAFGDAYADAAAPLRVLSLALVLMTVNAWQSLVLLAGGHQRITLAYNLVALAVSLVLCLVLVRAVGTVGAALAACATGLVVLAASTWAVRTRMAATLGAGSVGRILGGAALGTGVAAATRAAGAPWPLAGVAGVVTHLATVARLGVLRPIKEVLA